MATKKSYEVRFGINDTEVSKQLANIDKSLKGTQGELKLLKTNLSENWDTSKWVRAQEIASKAVEDSAKKVELLKKRFSEMESEGVTDKNKEAFESLRREIIAAENATEKAKKQLQSLNSIRLDAINKQLKQVSDSLTSFGARLSVGVTAPIIAAGAASIKMASDMDESVNKVDVVFGEAAKTVHEFSNTTLTAYGIAKSTALDMAALFGDMATSMGFSQAEAAKMSTELVALAGNLASFKNVSLDQVETALKSIYTGETESLKNFGIVMTETNLQAYALSQGIETTTSAMSQSEKVALRLQYVLDNTKNAQGDFARTSDSTANQLRILSESLKELAAIAGEELIPMVLPIIKQLNQIIQKVGQLDDGTKDMITKLAVFAAAFGPVLTVSGKLTGAVGSLIGAYKSLKAAQAAATAGQTALNAAMSANVAGAVASAIGVAVAALGSYAIASTLTSEKTADLRDSLNQIEDSYKSSIKSIEKTATAEKAELDIIEKLIPRYEELNKKSNKTATEKAELKNIVDQINDVLPDTIKLVNEEKTAYDATTESIRNTIEARKESIESIAKQNAAIKAQESLLELKSANDNMTLEYAQGRIESLREWQDGLKFNLFDFGATIDWIDNKVFKTGDVEDQIKDLENYIKQYKQYQSIIDSYSSLGSVGSDGESGKTSYLPQTFGKSSAEKALEDYKSRRATLDHQLAMDQISTERYYATLERYDRDYLAGYADNLTEHRRVLEELHKYKKSVQEEERQRLEELAEAEKKAQEESLKNAQEFTDQVISLAEKEADAKIAAIDAELAARNKLKAAQEKELQLQQAQAKLAFTRDDDSRESLSREIERLKSEIQESKIQADAESQKAMIQSQLDALKQSASSMMEQAKTQISPSSVNPYVSQLAPQLTINASGLSVAQAQILIQRAIEKLLYGM